MKCLVVRFSSIGDIVLTTPVIRSIKAHDPKNEIHFLTKEKFTTLLKANPYLTKVYGIEKKLSKVIPLLKAENYDYIFDLHHNIRTLELKLKLRKPMYSFDKVNLKKGAYVLFKKNLLPKTHVVERYLNVLRKVNIVSDRKGLDYFIPERDKVNFSLLPNEFRENYTALVIGGTYYTKRLPEYKIIEICDKVNGPIFIVGGMFEKGIGDKIKQLLGDKVYNGCGLFSINESAHIIQRSSVVITHDTGMMHIAAAFNKKIISIWGNTVPEFGMVPYQPDHSSEIFQVEGLSCRPCSKLGFNSCPKGHFKCMEDQDINRIADSVNGK